MPHAISRTTMVRMAVARLESTPSIPIFASMDVAAAKTAERIANINHISFIFIVSLYCKLDELQKSHCQVQFQDSQISSFNVLLVFNIASQPIDIATESWFVGKDAVKPPDMFVGKSNHHAHITHGE